MTQIIIPNVTPNFSWWEVKSRDTGKLPTEDATKMSNIQIMAVRFQRTRNYMKKPIHIRSWYRTPEHNEAVGGSESSLHSEGRALDIVCPQSEMVKALETYYLMGFTGLGFYPEKDFIHIDDRDIAIGKEPTLWIWTSARGYEYHEYNEFNSFRRLLEERIYP